MRKEGLAVHWEAAPPRSAHRQCPGQVEDVRRFHLNSGYSDIAYNFLVCVHGERFEGRGWDRDSAATCNGSWNRTYWSVCAMIGPGYESTPEMRAAIRAVWDEAQERGAHTVIGHRDACATECPGQELWEWVHEGLPVDDEPEPEPPQRWEDDDEMILCENFDEPGRFFIVTSAGLIECPPQEAVKLRLQGRMPDADKVGAWVLRKWQDQLRGIERPVING